MTKNGSVEQTAKEVEWLCESKTERAELIFILRSFKRVRIRENETPKRRKESSFSTAGWRPIRPQSSRVAVERTRLFRLLRKVSEVVGSVQFM